MAVNLTEGHADDGLERLANQEVRERRCRTWVGGGEGTGNWASHRANLTVARRVGRAEWGDRPGWWLVEGLHARLGSLDFLMGNKKREKVLEQESSTTRRYTHTEYFKLWQSDLHLHFTLKGIFLERHFPPQRPPSCWSSPMYRL